VDFVFMDPPYSDNVKYSEDPRCIGRINATDEAYFEALGASFREAHRVLKDRRYFAVYICDYYNKKRGFVPIGLRCLELLSRDFRLIDHVCVVRHNKSLKLGNWHKTAAEENFFLRGFNHLFIVKKELPPTPVASTPRPRAGKVRPS
jgi:adenine-specific DNA-methyltransferase